MASNERQERAQNQKNYPRLWVVLVAVALAIPVGVGIESLFFADRAGGGSIPRSSTPAGEAFTADEYPSVPFSKSFDGDDSINMTEEGIAVKGYDIIAYFTENEAVKGTSEIEATYEGATFRFSTEENRERFLEDPEKYIPAYGGYCALGVANGYKDDMDPAAFDVIDGRLYFNLYPRVHDYWKQNKEVLIARAEENWPDMKHAPGYGRADGR